VSAAWGWPGSPGPQQAAASVTMTVVEPGASVGSSDRIVTVDRPAGSPASATSKAAVAGSVVVWIVNVSMNPLGRASSQTVCQIPEVGVYQPTCLPVGRLGSVGSKTRTVTTAASPGRSAAVMSAANGE